MSKLKRIFLLRFLLTALFGSVLSAEPKKVLQKDSGYFRGEGVYFHVAVIGDWEGALKEWRSPSVRGAPTIKTKTEFNRGEMAIPFIMFATNGRDAEGNVDVTYDFKVNRPDGSVYIDQRDLVVFKGRPPDKMAMFQQPIGCRFEKDDPFGKYSLHVTINDNNKEISGSFEFAVELKKAEAEKEAESREFTWYDSEGRPTGDTASMKTKDGFGGKFILTTNQESHADRARTETPEIDSVSTVSVGELLLPVVIFVNPGTDEEGSIDVTCDLDILRPDGSVFRKIPDIVCGEGPIKGSKFDLRLSRSGVKWGADSDDPLGEWTFKVLLKDNVRRIEMPLKRSVEIVEMESDTAED